MTPDRFIEEWLPALDPAIAPDELLNFKRDVRAVATLARESAENCMARALKELGAVHEAANKAAHYLETP
jgi:hypothetical protein